MKLTALFTLASVLAVSARPTRRAEFSLQNGKDAIALNNDFKSLNANSPCKSGDIACVDGKFAQCNGGKFDLSPCPSGTTCAALPLVNKPGTSISCDSQVDIDARIAATGANNGGSGEKSKGKGNNNGDGQKGNNNDDDKGAQDKKDGNNKKGDNNREDNDQKDGQDKNGGNDQNDGDKKDGNDDNNKGGNDGKKGNGQKGENNGDSQSSRTLDDAVIAEGFAKDGQDPPADGQVASLTSTNNFINFCKTVDKPITNGKQIKSGSCNPAPMGVIPSNENMPSSKFVFPKNLATIKANKAFTIEMKIRKLETGNFVNAQENYFSAPQHLNGKGQIKGHSHVVVEKLDSLDSTEPNDPNTFAFFKGLNDKSKDGILTAEVDKGLPEGVYKISSINTAANHQPILVPIAQHGSLDDVVYFTVTKSGKS